MTQPEHKTAIVHETSDLSAWGGHTTHRKLFFQIQQCQYTHPYCLSDVVLYTKTWVKFLVSRNLCLETTI